jgi:hypothetical protein
MTAPLACTVKCRNQAMSQACAFVSLFWPMMSEIGIYQQLTKGPTLEQSRWGEMVYKKIL